MNRFYSILFLLTFISCKNSVESTSPILESISESVYASGVVKSKNQYQVNSTVNGLIQEILVTEGDLVSIGDPLIRILNEPSKLNSFNARLAADFSDLQANQNKIKESKITIELALNKLKNDSLLLVRQENLNRQGVGSQIDLEQRELAFKNSKTNYFVLLLRHRDLERQLVYTSAQTKTNLKISSAMAGDYIIKAESNGKIYKILKKKGELVNTLSSVAIIGDAVEFLIELKVDEYDIARINKGQNILFSMDSYKGKVFEAVVDKIEPLMDEQSKSFLIQALFLTKPTVLYPNLTVEANIIIRSKEKALTIPRSYLVGDSLVIVDKNEKRKVTIGLMDYSKVEILSGITRSDIVYRPIP